jgi:hypothetical protein
MPIRTKVCFSLTYDAISYTNFFQVLTLLIVNVNHFAPTAFDTVFRAVGLDTVSYRPTAAVTTVSDWPTLGSMIDSGQRLVTFLDFGADFTSVPYIIDGTHVSPGLVIFINFNNTFAEFTNIWETVFDATDTTFDCLVNRSNGDSSTEMFLINHFLDTIVLGEPTPDIASLNKTNAVSGAGSLGTQVNTCITTQGRPPNFLLVDVGHIYSYRNDLTCRPSSIMNLVEDLYSSWQQLSTGLHTAPLLQLRHLPRLPHLSLQRH